MAEATTYKCPNCGAFQTYNPDAENWHCPFCGADFSPQGVLEKGEAFDREAQKQAEKKVSETPPQEGDEVSYHCPSCGSEIITDATTVATSCYYCHNPVILQGKLTADMRPDQVLPFSISKEKAVDKFLTWVKTKKFIPEGFFSKEEVDTMSGVYYPHFITDCEMDGSFTGEGKNVSTMDMGKYIVTKTDHYAFRRSAKLHFHNVMRSALKSVDRKLSDGIHPFPLEEVKPFSSAYLSGFLAERRDIDVSEIESDVRQELEGYVKPMLSETIQYNSYSGQSTAQIKKQQASYVLLPTWVLTYHPRQGNIKPFYYVMNGRTGAVCGKLPINNKKLNLTGLLIAATIFIVLCLAGYFLY